MLEKRKKEDEGSNAREKTMRKRKREYTISLLRVRKRDETLGKENAWLVPT